MSVRKTRSQTKKQEIDRVQFLESREQAFNELVNDSNPNLKSIIEFINAQPINDSTYKTFDKWEVVLKKWIQNKQDKQVLDLLHHLHAEDIDFILYNAKKILELFFPIIDSLNPVRLKLFLSNIYIFDMKYWMEYFEECMERHKYTVLFVYIERGIETRRIKYNDVYNILGLFIKYRQHELLFKSNIWKFETIKAMFLPSEKAWSSYLAKKLKEDNFEFVKIIGEYELMDMDVFWMVLSDWFEATKSKNISQNVMDFLDWHAQIMPKGQLDDLGLLEYAKRTGPRAMLWFKKYINHITFDSNLAMDRLYPNMLRFLLKLKKGKGKDDDETLYNSLLQKLVEYKEEPIVNKFLNYVCQEYVEHHSNAAAEAIIVFLIKHWNMPINKIMVTVPSIIVNVNVFVLALLRHNVRAVKFFLLYGANVKECVLTPADLAKASNNEQIQKAMEFERLAINMVRRAKERFYDPDRFLPKHGAEKAASLQQFDKTAQKS